MHIKLSLFYFAYFSLVGVYVMFIPNALIELGYSSIEVGLVTAGAPFMRFLLPFIFKYYIRLTDTIYIIALLFTFLGSLFLFLSVENFRFYFFSSLIFGGSMGIILPFVETLALQKLSKKLYGKIRLWGSIGFILIALWFGQVEILSLETFYYLMGSALFASLFGYTLLKYEERDKEKRQEEDASFSLKKYWAFWTSIFLMQVAFGGFYTFFTIYEKNIAGVSTEMIGYLWSFGVLCEIVMLYFQSPLLQANLLTILKVSTLITAFRWLLLYLYPTSLFFSFLSQSLHAISFALYHTVAITYVFTLYSQKRLAQQFFLGISFGLGGSVGSYFAGYINGEMLFLFESIITLLAFGILFFHNNPKA